MTQSLRTVRVAWSSWVSYESSELLLDVGASGPGAAVTHSAFVHLDKEHFTGEYWQASRESGASQLPVGASVRHWHSGLQESQQTITSMGKQTGAGVLHGDHMARAALLLLRPLRLWVHLQCNKRSMSGLGQLIQARGARAAGLRIAV